MIFHPLVYTPSWGLVKAKSQELHPGPPCECRCPLLLSQVHQQGTGLEVEEPRLGLVPIGDVNIAGYS